MHWVVSMMIAGGLTPIWGNHHDEISQLRIYHQSIILQWYQLLCRKQQRSSHFIEGNICILDTCIVITYENSALVQQMAWCPQATNHYLITWSKVYDGPWVHIASLGFNKLFYHYVDEIFWPQPITSLKLGHVTGQGSMSPTWVGRVSDPG